MYKILGGDGKEYGPVSADTLRQWVREGRANAQTQVKPDGAANWQPLASIVEVASEFSAPATIGPLTSAGAPPAPAGAIYTGDYELDILGCISRAFELFKGNMGAMIVATLIAFSPQIIGMVVRVFSVIPFIGILFALLGFVISMASIVIGGPLLGGLYSVLLKLARGQAVEPRDSFAGFKNNFLHLFLGHFIPGLFVGLCMIPVAVVAIVTIIIVIINDPQHAPPEFSALIPTLVTLAITIPVIAWLSTNWIFTLALVIDRNLDFWTAMKTSWRRVMCHWWTVFGLLIVMSLINFVGILACGVGLLFTMPITFAALMQAYETIFTPRAAQPGPGA